MMDKINISLNEVVSHGVNCLLLANNQMLRKLSIQELRELLLFMGLGELYTTVVTKAIISERPLLAEDIPYPQLVDDGNNRAHVDSKHLENDTIGALYKENVVIVIGDHGFHRYFNEKNNGNPNVYCLGCNIEHPRIDTWFPANVVNSTINVSCCYHSHSDSTVVPTTVVVH